MARRLAQEEGMFVGGSSGSAVAGAIRWLSKRPIPEGSTVIVLLPDSGDRYLSKFYSDDWLREKGFLDTGATARELLARKAPTPALVAADPTTVVGDALQLLRHHGITQMPVLAGHANVGSIQEEDILRRSLADDTGPAPDGSIGPPAGVPRGVGGRPRLGAAPLAPGGAGPLGAGRGDRDRGRRPHPSRPDRFPLRAGGQSCGLTRE